MNLNHVVARASARAAVMLDERHSPVLTIDAPPRAVHAHYDRRGRPAGVITDTAFLDTEGSEFR